MSIKINDSIIRDYLDEALSGDEGITVSKRNNKLNMKINMDDVSGLVCETMSLLSTTFKNQGMSGGSWFIIDNSAWKKESYPAKKPDLKKENHPVEETILKKYTIQYFFTKLNLNEKFKLFTSTKARCLMGMYLNGNTTEPPKGKVSFAIYKSKKEKNIPYNKVSLELVANTDNFIYEHNKEWNLSSIPSGDKELNPKLFDYWACIILSNLGPKEKTCMPGSYTSDIIGKNIIYTSLRHEEEIVLNEEEDPGKVIITPTKIIPPGSLKNDTGQTFFIRFYNALGGNNAV